MRVMLKATYVFTLGPDQKFELVECIRKQTTDSESKYAIFQPRERPIIYIFSFADLTIPCFEVALHLVKKINAFVTVCWITLT